MIRFNFEKLTPTDIAKSLVEKIRRQRKRLGLSQEELAKKSGVSLGSVKRFETKHEISLFSFIKISIVLDLGAELDDLFTTTRYSSIEDVIKEQKNG